MAPATGGASDGQAPPRVGSKRNRARATLYISVSSHRYANKVMPQMGKEKGPVEATWRLLVPVPPSSRRPPVVARHCEMA